MQLIDLKGFLLDKNLRGVFLIDYFGLSDLQPYIELIKSRRPDVLIIVDAVQAFLSLVLFRCYPRFVSYAHLEHFRNLLSCSGSLGSDKWSTYMVYLLHCSGSHIRTLDMFFVTSASPSYT